MKKLFIVAVVSVLTGCGTPSGLIGELPVVPDQANVANVVVVRISSVIGAANGYTVALDGKDIFGIGSGEHAQFAVAPGEHYIAVKCFGGWSPTWKEESLKFSAAAGASTFFLVSPSGSCAEIKPSTEAEARTHLAGSKQVELDAGAPSTNPSTRSDSQRARRPLRDVPAIKVVVDCGACQVRPEVPGHIAEGYARAAAEARARLAPNQEATVSIKYYAARNDAARFLLGVLAGKDEIRASVSFEGKEFIVEDYYMNAWLGIEYLASKIGGMVFEQLNQSPVADSVPVGTRPQPAADDRNMFRRGKRRTPGG
jgi:hypothetical protein